MVSSALEVARKLQSDMEASKLDEAQAFAPHPTSVDVAADLAALSSQLQGDGVGVVGGDDDVAVAWEFGDTHGLVDGEVPVCGTCCCAPPDCSCECLDHDWIMRVLQEGAAEREARDKLAHLAGTVSRHPVLATLAQDMERVIDRTTHVRVSVGTAELDPAAVAALERRLGASVRQCRWTLEYSLLPLAQAQKDAAITVRINNRGPALSMKPRRGSVSIRRSPRASFTPASAHRGARTPAVPTTPGTPAVPTTLATPSASGLGLGFGAGRQRRSPRTPAERRQAERLVTFESVFDSPAHMDRAGLSAWLEGSLKVKLLCECLPALNGQDRGARHSPSTPGAGAGELLVGVGTLPLRQLLLSPNVTLDSVVELVRPPPSQASQPANTDAREGADNSAGHSPSVQQAGGRDLPPRRGRRRRPTATPSRHGAPRTPSTAGRHRRRASPAAGEDGAAAALPGVVGWLGIQLALLGAATPAKAGSGVATVTFRGSESDAGSDAATRQRDGGEGTDVKTGEGVPTDASVDGVAPWLIGGDAGSAARVNGSGIRFLTFVHAVERLNVRAAMADPQAAGRMTVCAVSAHVPLSGLSTHDEEGVPVGVVKLPGLALPPASRRNKWGCAACVFVPVLNESLLPRLQANFLVRVWWPCCCRVVVVSPCTDARLIGIVIQFVEIWTQVLATRATGSVRTTQLLGLVKIPLDSLCSLYDQQVPCCMALLHLTCVRVCLIRCSQVRLQARWICVHRTQPRRGCSHVSIPRRQPRDWPCHRLCGADGGPWQAREGCAAPQAMRGHV